MQFGTSLSLNWIELSSLRATGAGYIVGHLFYYCRLMDQSEANRMTAQNLAIVWGPNLMWPRYDSGDIAVNMVHQNQIIEFLLLEFDHVFK